MYNYFLAVLYCCEILAFVVSIKYWRSSKEHQYFSAYLLLVCVVETAGKLAYESGDKKLNHFLFDYFMIPIEFLFFYRLYYKNGRATKLKSVPFFLMSLYLIGLVVDILFLEKRHFAFYSFSYTLGNFFLLLLILNYFYSVIRSEQILHFKSDRLFWVSIGLLIFYLGSFPFYGLRNFLWDNDKNIFTRYWCLVTSFNCIMYLFFVLSFLWGKPKLSSSSS